MINKLLLMLSAFLCTQLHAVIVEIHQIDDIRPYVIAKNGLYLFDIDDTLISNPTTLGSGPWRSWALSKIPDLGTSFSLFDALTFYIASRVPYIAVEPATSRLIADLQENGHTVFAFTARGRSQWYSTDIDGLDQFTHRQLRSAGIDFSQTKIPQELRSLNDKYFHEGVIFASHIIKGELLKLLFKDLNYQPSLLLFVDDRLSQVQSVESFALEHGIPFVGFWYKRSEIDNDHFTPLITNLQLEYLLINGEILRDADALELAKIYAEVDHQKVFEEILRKIDIEVLAPTRVLELPR